MKYNARRTEIDGFIFDSKKEAARYLELKALEKAGKIKELERQKSFTLIEPFDYNGEKCRRVRYLADFYYREGGKVIIEDVKGMKTEVYKIKKKMLLKKLKEDGLEGAVIFRETI